MGLGAFVALVRKDLQLFFSDRRAVILTFAVPIAIASFFGSIFRGGGDDDAEPARIPIAIVDSDVAMDSEVSVLWGEPDGGTRKPAVERHRQIEIRARVRSVPYSRTTVRNAA